MSGSLRDSAEHVAAVSGKTLKESDILGAAGPHA
jgi:hypothetical protein